MRLTYGKSETGGEGTPWLREPLALPRKPEESGCGAVCLQHNSSPAACNLLVRYGVPRASTPALLPYFF